MTPASVRMWGQVATAAQTMLLFLAVVIVVFLMKNEMLIGVIVGYVAKDAGAVIAFYFGSSAGSQAKDEKLQPPPPEPKS